jgi:hypothetical protein
MLPYSAQDMVRVMKNEMQPEDERRFGRQIARDIRRDDDRDDARRPDRGERFSLRLLFLRGATIGRGA